MEVCFIVKTSKKEDLARFTEKAFLGRLCEEAATHFLIHRYGFECIKRNVRFKIGEIDLVVQNQRNGQKWVVEVRGRKGKEQTARWLSRHKIQKLKKLAQILSLKTGHPYRLMFVQVEILRMGRNQDCPDRFEWKLKMSDFELLADS
jgi:Holliday junction resolvase-like predicted endonuclease